MEVLSLHLGCTCSPDIPSKVSVFVYKPGQPYYEKKKKKVFYCQMDKSIHQMTHMNSENKESMTLLMEPETLT